MYILTEKRGRKRYGLAVWTPDNMGQTCARLAECVFTHYGLKGEACRGSVAEFKNFAGIDENAPRLTDTLEDSQRYHSEQIAADYKRMNCDYAAYIAGQGEGLTAEEYEAA